MTTLIDVPELPDELRALDEDRLRGAEEIRALPMVHAADLERVRQLRAQISEATDFDVVEDLAQQLAQAEAKVRRFDDVAKKKRDNHAKVGEHRLRVARQLAQAAFAREAEACDQLIREAFDLPPTAWGRFLPQAQAIAHRVSWWFGQIQHGLTGWPYLGNLPLPARVPFCAWRAWATYSRPRRIEDATPLDVVQAILSSATYQRLLREHYR